MESQTKTIETTRSFLSATTSLAASAVLARTVINIILPSQLQTIVSSRFHALRSSLSTDHTILIHESEPGMSKNPHLFLACRTYLSSITSSSTSKFGATIHGNTGAITFFLEEGQEAIDVFEGVEFRWRLLHREARQTVFIQGLATRVPRRDQFFELCFHKNHKKIALGSYLRHVIEESDRIKVADSSVKIYMNEGSHWLRQASELLHPATFETLPMNFDLKQRIVEDLSRFSRGEECYKRRGKSWIRSYLLYGPSGTGKTSLIVAMAKFLRLDIYDMDIKELSRISGAKCLLLWMSKRSMLVVEDVDGLTKHSAENADKNGDFSPTELLNCVDRLWTRSGNDSGERVLVFTAREKERLDPLLLHPGRIDMCFPMSYCGASGFKLLARNHHGVDDHWRFREIEELLKEVEVTPAEVGEELMRSEDVDVALDGLVQFLHRKRRVDRGGGEGAVTGLNDQFKPRLCLTDGNAGTVAVGSTVYRGGGPGGRGRGRGRGRCRGRWRR